MHVIDLAFVLPAHVLAGVLLWKRRAAGELLGPIVLAFGVLMAGPVVERATTEARLTLAPPMVMRPVMAPVFARNACVG